MLLTLAQAPNRMDRMPDRGAFAPSRARPERTEAEQEKEAIGSAAVVRSGVTELRGARMTSFRWLVRKMVETGADLAVLVGALAIAFAIRFEGAVPPHYAQVFRNWLPIVIGIQVAALLALDVQRLTWRLISLFEARRIARAGALSGSALFLWRLASSRAGDTWLVPLYEQVPVSVILMDTVFSVVGLVGMRACARLWSEWRERAQLPTTPRVRTLLIGAGRRGAAVARELAEHPEIGIDPVGFIDDLPAKQGTCIQGLRVLGSSRQVTALAQQHAAKQALITAANTSGADLLRIVEACEKAGLSTKVIPGLHELVDGKARVAGMRDLVIEDLLLRPARAVNTEKVAPLFRGRTVLVTGAGGSIGSELCREICRCAPATVVLVEQAENNLFHIHRRLMADFPAVTVAPCVADVCDRTRMQKILTLHRPAVVFHAAAHKHVPLMEWNPGEAVKNNIMGTRLLADLAAAQRVERFVMISTDKAVNPTSVMGASKRVAEIYVQALSRQTDTQFVAVRFGNVWASAGSVVPIFQEQIARGGPVTVTHPDMMRYFMTIPEACQLVLQAAALGKGGEIFVLDMGQPVKILDLARRLIRMAGLTPDVDIPIQFTGIRPGEKLFEELSFNDENTEATECPGILKGRLQPHAWEEINEHIEELCQLADFGDPARIREKLHEIVPEYRNGLARSSAHAIVPSVADPAPGAIGSQDVVLAGATGALEAVSTSAEN